VDDPHEKCADFRRFMALSPRNGIKPPRNAEAWIKNDSKASAVMNLSITSVQFHHIKRATSSKQAWDILKDIHESRGPL